MASEDVKVSEDVSTKAVLMPFNPFLHAGSLMLCSLVGCAHKPRGERLFRDAGTRFSHVTGFVREMCGGSSVGYSKPTYLLLKQRALKVRALS